ncbi:MAG TPA: 2-dehydropantoate 2-reductase [Pseudomonadales bacterium]|nr:2-dehydropantoate 2-reductase [Pseudomonadales bacterium]
MTRAQNIYVLGCGAIGLALAAHLADSGRNVIAVRTSTDEVPAGKILITVHTGEGVLKAHVETVSLSQLSQLSGIIVVTAKSYANKTIAAALKERVVSGPLVIMQNGIGVENLYRESGFPQIFRCVLYTTGQIISKNVVTFRPIATSPIGPVKGKPSGLKQCVETLSTRGFPFHSENDIQKHIWKKAIINSVFNTLCPLLEVDNGIFVRDAEVARLASEIIAECLLLANARNVSLSGSELMEQIMKISHGSRGVLISTLQDIENGRETEIESLNLEMARIASSMNPQINLTKTELLGRMVLAKSKLRISQ